MRAWWAGLPKVAKWSIAIVAALILIGGCSALIGDDGSEGEDQTTTEAAAPTTTEEEAEQTETEPAGPPGDNIRARSTEFVQAMRFCQRSVSVLRGAIVRGEASSLIELADATRTSKQICDRVQDQLRELDTEHFDDQALTAQVAVDSWKDGLDALADYIDDEEPSKLLEARDKLNEGDAIAEQAVSEINERRAVYDVPPLS
jgi:hypothetical protein